MVARGQRRRSEHLEVAVRVVEYTITNRGPAAEGPEADQPETIRLITSILDHELAPAAELAALYHQRWEIELAFDEIETHQIGHPRALRSRSPQMVRQEIWALLLTHYAIRHLMFEAADDIDTDPDRISFLRTLRIVRRQVTDQAAFFPPADSPQRSRQQSLKSSSDSTRYDDSEPAHAPSNEDSSDDATTPTQLQDHPPRKADRHSAAQIHRITEWH
jgi:hypothetical protein